MLTVYIAEGREVCAGLLPVDPAVPRRLTNDLEGASHMPIEEAVSDLILFTNTP